MDGVDGFSLLQSASKQDPDPKQKSSAPVAQTQAISVAETQPLSMIEEPPQYGDTVNSSKSQDQEKLQFQTSSTMGNEV